MDNENDADLPQTQSQSNNLDDETFSQVEENAQDTWGRLLAKHKSFKNFDLKTGSFVVGRATTSNYVLEGKKPKIKDQKGIDQKLLVQMSKKHFEITKDLSSIDTPICIEDFSRNGTFINEDKIGMGQKRLLAHGDIISIAHPKLKAFFFHQVHRTENDLPEDINGKYHVGKKLGSGACGTVYLVHEYRTCEMYALKHIKKNTLIDYKSCDKSLNEGKILQRLTHPCIVKMHDVLDRPDSVYITLELMKGGELLTRIQKKRFLTEANSKIFFYQMCDAIKYLHQNKITHRDLKPDNILLASNDENTLLKISDFGLSKRIQNDSVLRTLCGTPLYVAPEVLLTNGKGEYTEKVDIWSLGVVLFTMLSGTLPFADEYGSPATEQIKRGKFQFRSVNWHNVSAPAKSFIKEILTTDVQSRPSIHELLTHKWLSDYSTIVAAHKIMGLKTPQHYETQATRMALNVPQCSADSTSDVFARPYQVNNGSDTYQQPKRKRIR